MSLREVNGTKLYYEVNGQGSETLFFCHGLLFSGEMWSGQVTTFSDRYCCVTYDHRGQGRSGRQGGRDMDLLAADAIALIESLGKGPVHFVGLSMGGFVGLRVAARRPDLLRSLILLNTSAEEEPNKVKYGLLVAMVRLFGVKAVSNRIMPILFGKTTLQTPQQQEMLRRWQNWLNQLPRDVTDAVNGVISRRAVLDEIRAIPCPTLIIAGEEDIATTSAKSKRLAAAISDSRLEFLPGIGHMSALESPDRVNTLISGFLARFDRGN